MSDTATRSNHHPHGTALLMETARHALRDASYAADQDNEVDALYETVEAVRTLVEAACPTLTRDQIRDTKRNLRAAIDMLTEESKHILPRKTQ